MMIFFSFFQIFSWVLFYTSVYQERKGTSKKQWLLMLFLLLFFVLFLRQWMFGTVRDRN
jgi:hypothetical protein